jgi:competence protein ComEA
MDDAMPDPTREADPTGRLARWFQPSPPELAGLAVLVLGAIVATSLLWLQAAQRPSELGSEAATAGAAVGADGTTDGPAPGVTDEPYADAHTVDGYDSSEDDPAARPGEQTAAVAAPGPAPEATVHVTGAVANPGLVVLAEGGRVGDAVAAAGGLVAGAQDERINLARPVVDGEHVHVPREGEEPVPVEVAPGGDASTDGGSGGVAPGDGRVDINRAGAAELETLPGIGPARAEAIIAHREQHGPFAAPGDLRAVSGIGEVIFQRLAELVTVG